MCQNFLIDRLTHAAIAVLRFALFVLLLPSVGWTDSWPGAVPFQVFSKSAKYFVRVIPGESIGDTIGFAGARKGKYAQALYYALQADRSYKLLHEIKLQNPVAPVDLLLSDRGQFVTFDNWHNLGYGKVVAIYAASGKLVRSYEIDQLYSIVTAGEDSRFGFVPSLALPAEPFRRTEGAKECLCAGSHGWIFCFHFGDG